MPAWRRWRAAILLAVAAAAVVLVLRTGDAVSSPQRSKGRQLAVQRDSYQLLERSWASRPAPAEEDEGDPETERLQAMRAQQWQNMDISIQGDR